MKKKLTRGKLVKKLDVIFSKFIRLYYSKNGICTCYTCWVKLPRTKIQNGHFISRSNYNYRWDIQNCRPQCMACNIFKHWNYIEYTMNMIKEKWSKFVDDMKNNKELVKISTPDIEAMIREYEEKVDILLSKQPLKKQKKSV